MAYRPKIDLILIGTVFYTFILLIIIFNPFVSIEEDVKRRYSKVHLHAPPARQFPADGATNSNTKPNNITSASKKESLLFEHIDKNLLKIDGTLLKRYTYAENFTKKAPRLYMPRFN
jgi:hypothetical protein